MAAFVKLYPLEEGCGEPWFPASEQENATKP